jgi:hypothetical protein
MPTTEDFLLAAQWSGILTLVVAGLALLGWLLQWGIRFRLVGVTGFMAVLTVGLFALGLVPFTRTVIPGAVKFSTVYDSGGTQAVIAVPSDITESQLEATLLQAASNLFSPGRLGQGESQLTIRARAVVHPEPGISQPLYLGEIKRSLLVRDDDNMTVTLDAEAFAKLPTPGLDETSTSTS